MARAFGTIDFDADVGAIGYALGAIDGMCVSVDTTHYVNAVLAETHAQLAKRFDTHARAVSMSNPKGFKHVYEWNMNGVLKGKLWKHRLTGYGRSRTAQFELLPSKTPIPKPTPRSTGVSQAELDRLSNRRYVFRLKAIVIEFGIPVDIRPKNAKRLFVPLRGQTPQFANAKDRERAQRRGFVFAQSVHIERPGGDATGNFQKLWFEWWGNAAEGHVNKEITPRLEKRLEEISTIKGAVARRSASYSRKQFKIAFASGRAGAQAVAVLQEQAALKTARALEVLDQV